MLELLKFSVKGFKGFKDEITLDMTDKREQTTESKGMAIILGKEGAGRTNLGEALFDIAYNFNKSLVRPKSMYAYANSSVAVEFCYELCDSVLKAVYRYRYKVYDGEIYDVLLDETTDKYPISEDKRDKVLKDISDFAQSMLFIKNCKERFPMRAEDLKGELLPSDDFLRDFEEFLVSSFGYEVDFVKINSELYFKKNGVVLPFFKCANKRLVDLYLLVNSVGCDCYFEDEKYSLIYVDDLPFIKDITKTPSPAILTFLENRAQQVIVAPIDTIYFKFDRPKEDLYIIANGQVKEIQEWTPKNLQYGHNFEGLYRGGAFDE